MIRIFTGVLIKVKYYWKKLHISKKLGLICLSLIIVSFLYQVVGRYFPGYVTSGKSDDVSSIQINVHESVSKPEAVIYPIEISTVPFEQLKIFATNDYNYPVFKLNGHQYEIVYQDKKITHLQLSPDERKIGFYIHAPQDEMELNKTSLVIMDIAKRNFREISEGELKVSNWEWENSNEFIIYINCGTGCHLAHVRSVKDGKLIAKYLDRQDWEY